MLLTLLLVNRQQQVLQCTPLIRLQRLYVHRQHFLRPGRQIDGSLRRLTDRAVAEHLGGAHFEIAGVRKLAHGHAMQPIEVLLMLRATQRTASRARKAARQRNTAGINMQPSRAVKGGGRTVERDTLGTLGGPRMSEMGGAGARGEDDVVAGPQAIQ